MDKALTFGEIDALSQALAAWLQSRGLEKGARVAIMMPNVLQYPVAVAAVWRAGLIAVNVNPLYTARELEHQLKDSGAEAVIVLENFAATLQAAIAGTPVKHVVVGSLGRPAGLSQGPDRQLRRAHGAQDDPGLVAARAFQVQRRDRRRQVDDVRAPGARAARTSPCCNTPAARPASPRVPRCSIAPSSPTCWRPRRGCSPACIARSSRASSPSSAPCRSITSSPSSPAACSACAPARVNILIPNPRDMKGTIKELAKYHINIFPAVNTLFNGLASQPEFAKLDFSGLVISNGGGMAVQEAVAQQVARRHRLPDRRGLWPERDLGRRHLQSHRLRRLHRHDRPAAAQCRDQDPRRSGRGAAARRGRRDRDQAARRSCATTGSSRRRRPRS